MVFIAYIVGLEKPVKALAFIQRLLEAAGEVITREVSRGSLRSRSFPLLVISPPYIKRKKKPVFLPFSVMLF